MGYVLDANQVIQRITKILSGRTKILVEFVTPASMAYIYDEDANQVWMKVFDPGPPPHIHVVDVGPASGVLSRGELDANQVLQSLLVVGPPAAIRVVKV